MFQVRVQIFDPRGNGNFRPESHKARRQHRSLYEREDRGGIRKAFEKRPLSHDDFHSLIAGIEQDIQKSGKEQIPAKEIGNIVMRRIKTKDQVAYIRFASVYRQFADVEEFVKEAKKL